MPPLDITDEQRERIDALRRELADAHAGPYASVDAADAVAYLLDLADAVEDPDRRAAPAGATLADSLPADSSPEDSTPTANEFPREALARRLDERTRKHADPDDADRMDLYSIAAAYDVTGRSDMTKAELVEAILDAAERLSADPFAPVDVAFPPDAADGDALGGDDGGGDEDKTDAGEADDVEEADAEAGAEENDAEAGAEETDAEGDGDDQLDEMLSLLDTHEDKWREADGDARYEVDLPDGRGATRENSLRSGLGRI